MHATGKSAEGVSKAAMAPHAAARSGEAVTFMHLPAEIRNEIYGLALVHDKALNFSRYTVKIPKRLLRRNPSLGCTPRYRLKSTTDVLSGNKRGIPVPQVITMALLMTSKTVNIEASAVFLRENDFGFWGTPALHHFCAALGDKMRSLARVTVRNIAASSLAHEQICILACLEEPKSINVGARIYGPGTYNALSPSATWEFIKPIIWRLEQPVKPRMSCHPSVSEETQRKRLDAFAFDLAGHDTIMVRDRGFETITDEVECQARFKGLVVECWREEVRVMGVGKKRDGGGLREDLGGDKKPRLA